jgi:hypothetical protein
MRQSFSDELKNTTIDCKKSIRRQISQSADNCYFVTKKCLLYLAKNKKYKFFNTLLASATKSFCWFFCFICSSCYILLRSQPVFRIMQRRPQLSLRNLIPETFDYVLKFIVTIPFGI